MADEIDDTQDAEEQAATPEEKTSESAKTSSDAHDEGAALETTSAVPEVAASEFPAGRSANVTPPSSAGASAAESSETLYEAGPQVDSRQQTHREASSGGAAVKSGEPSRVESGELDKPGLDLLYDVELDATLQFGSRELLLRDVLELGPGDVVELDRHIAEPVDLVVGDRIVARGEVVVASGNFALRVTEVATPQMRLESIRCLF